MPKIPKHVYTPTTNLSKIDKLKAMVKANPRNANNVLAMFKILDLDIEDEETAEYSDITDIEKIFKKAKEENMNKKYKNKVEVPDNNYFKFEDDGQELEIKSCVPNQVKNMDGEMETRYTVEDELGEELILPNHHNLSKRLKNLIAIDYDFSKGACIVYEGEIKHPTDKKKTIKQYQVYTV